MNKVLAFLRQPLNQAAFIAIGGSVWAVLQGTMSLYAALPVIGGAVVAWLLPDNSVAKEDVEAAITAGIQVLKDFHVQQAAGGQNAAAGNSQNPPPPAAQG